MGATNTFPLIDLTGERQPLFLCDWDSGEFVEIHTVDTLRGTYGETNLFDGTRHDWGHEFTNATLDEILSYLVDGDSDDRRRFCTDNMSIQRIK